MDAMWSGWRVDGRRAQLSSADGSAEPKGPASPGSSRGGGNVEREPRRNEGRGTWTRQTKRADLMHATTMMVVMLREGNFSGFGGARISHPDAGLLAGEIPKVGGGGSAGKKLNNQALQRHNSMAGWGRMVTG
ncbi:hypothetical protein B2J93_2327 [Marssonina coronariae]|uniref:Uncharacterized protein n=1 Tax=Diplocarpon coronariae TaxID=2795749 RepID=A0A218Z3B9_9HELO|nr:hypothetical protein B2J93_2327 [Marssonina coronariae]